MKKIIFTLLSFCIVCFQLNAQHCSGGSGPSVCVPADTATKPGLAPVSDSLAPLVNGSSTGAVIQFENFDTITYAGTTYHVKGLVIDSITNLPAGLCWASNVASDSFAAKAYGCIALSGTVCATPGQYKLYIKVTVYTQELPFGLPVSADAAGLYYYIRVINHGDVVTPVDTTGEAHGTISTFMHYGTETASCSVGISEIGANINTLNIYPNPLSSEAVISFNSDKAERMTEKLTNILGSEVYRKDMEVAMGANTHTISRGNLSSGVYFYTISDGRSVYTKRIVITE